MAAACSCCSPGTRRSSFAPRAEGRLLRQGIAVAAVVIAVALALIGIDAALGGLSHVTGRRSGTAPAHSLATSPTGSSCRYAGPPRRSGRDSSFASSAVLVAVAIRRPRRPVTDALLVALLVSLVVNDNG